VKRQLKETLKRFNEILKYDVSGKKLITEDEDASLIVGEIIDSIQPDLPLDEYSNAVESIILLQKTLVDLNKLNKTYGINEDGVDGDFGTDTSTALYNTIKSKELTADNIDKFEVVLENNKEVLEDTLDNYEEFIEKYKEQGGVSLQYMGICVANSKKWYPKLDFVIKRKQCHPIKDIAETLTEVFPEESDINKAAILSVMMKEQGKGKYICASNNNYAGVQTDTGRWKPESLSEKIDDQFCAKDREKVRSFASFDTLLNGLAFIRDSFDERNWFITLLKDVSDEEVETVDFDIDKVSKKHADIWQTKWNMSMTDDQFELFKKYGYNFNPVIKKQSFTTTKGIYNKAVEDLTEKELEIHNQYKDNEYRSPADVKKSLDAVSSYFKKAYKYFTPTNIIKVDI